jgi:hypothetical protein
MGVGIHALSGPRIIRAMQHAALVVTRAVGVLGCRGARRSVRSGVRGAHLFVETATSPAHHWARRYGLRYSCILSICLVCLLGLQCKRAHGRRVVSYRIVLY